jgi:hypothetical protein
MLAGVQAGLESGLFFEFPPRAREFVLVAVEETLRYRPGTLILCCPIRPAWVDEKDLRA